MIGLIALAILGFWGFVVYKLSGFLVKKIKNELVKYGTQIILCALFFLVPVADEIIGGFQFRKLCNEGAVMTFDEDNARRKTVVGSYENLTLSGYILPIIKSTYSFKDVGTNEILVSWIQYQATGGWLAQTINFNSVNSPYTFNGHCSPENYWKKFKSLNLNEIK